MSNIQKRTKMYTIIAAASIAILAIGVIEGFWVNTPNTTNTTVIPTANGNTSSDFVTKQTAGTSTLITNSEQNDAFQLFVTGTASKKISPDKVSVTLWSRDAGEDSTGSCKEEC